MTDSTPHLTSGDHEVRKGGGGGALFGQVTGSLTPGVLDDVVTIPVPHHSQRMGQVAGVALCSAWTIYTTVIEPQLQGTARATHGRDIEELN